MATTSASNHPNKGGELAWLEKPLGRDAWVPQHRARHEAQGARCSPSCCSPVLDYWQHAPPAAGRLVANRSALWHRGEASLETTLLNWPKKEQGLVWISDLIHSISDLLSNVIK
jgi:hypothetical protein